MVLEIAVFFPIKCLLNSMNDVVGIIHSCHKVILKSYQISDSNQFNLEYLFT